MPAKKSKKKNEDFEDYFFGDAEAVNNETENKNNDVSTG